MIRPRLVAYFSRRGRDTSMGRVRLHLTAGERRLVGDGQFRLKDWPLDPKCAELKIGTFRDSLALVSADSAIGFCIQSESVKARNCIFTHAPWLLRGVGILMRYCAEASGDLALLQLKIDYLQQGSEYV